LAGVSLVFESFSLAVALSWLAQVEALFSALCLGSLLAAKADIEVASVIMENMRISAFFMFFSFFI